MKNSLWARLFALAGATLFSMFLADISAADIQNVENQEPKYGYTSAPSEKLFIQRTSSADDLVTNATAGVTQGVDSNPLLDSSHKADNYTQEMVDMHFKYPAKGWFRGSTKSKFGFSITNINYYEITDVNIFDAVIDANIERELSEGVTLNAGYLFEMMWFPNNDDGTYAGNGFTASIKQKLTKSIYQKFSYWLLLKNYPENHVTLSNGTKGSELRADLRNTFEYELGMYIGKYTKLRVINRLALNDSNYTYGDFYDYFDYRVGGSVIQFFTEKLYGICGFYYQRRNYEDRLTAQRGSRQKDNLYTVTGSLMYDVTRNISLFINYSHSEDHSNEPLDRYVGSLYSAGLYYRF